MSTQAPSADELRTAIADRQWYHTIELAPGLVTPGWFDTRPVASKIPMPASLAGKRCLDVGTFDGFWAFEMERRGAAEVVALDVDDPAALDWPFDARTDGPETLRRVRSERGPGFRIASDALGSRVRRVDLNVYDASPDRVGRFDVVLVGAILLHLRDPIRALEALRTVTRGELLAVEAIDPRLQVRLRRTPAARLHGLGLEAQWWLPNAAGLERMLTAAGFAVEARTRPLVTPFGSSPWAPSRRRSRRLRNLLLARDATDGALTVAVRATARDADA